MKARSMVAVLFAVMALAPAPVLAAQSSCANGYLLCLNEAQDSNWFVRTAMEFECGVGYYGCMRAKASGC